MLAFLVAFHQSSAIYCKFGESQKKLIQEDLSPIGNFFLTKQFFYLKPLYVEFLLYLYRLANDNTLDLYLHLQYYLSTCDP